MDGVLRIFIRFGKKVDKLTYISDFAYNQTSTNMLFAYLHRSWKKMCMSDQRIFYKKDVA